MGFWRSVFGLGQVVEQVTSAPAFAVDADSIDPAVFGLTSYSSPTAPAPRVDRRAAIQVPAVKRVRDLVAGTLGTLPIGLIGPDQKPAYSALFTQPEANVPRSVTMTRLYEDLLFESIAWWRITEFGWHGFPTKVKRLDPRLVDVRTDAVYVEGKKVPDADLIRFDSPNDPLLVAGARAIRDAMALGAAASRNSDGTPPLDYFTPAENADPVGDDEIVEILDAWKTARQTRSTGYVPAALKYNLGGLSPKDLQLSEARQHARLEIGLAGGVDPEELGVSTTSRTYANQFDRRKAFTDFTLGGYRTAVEDRLSMGDVSPRGYTAQVGLDAFLISDTLTRYQGYVLGLQTGAITQDEIRVEEKKPLLTPAQKQEITTVTPAPAAQASASETFASEAVAVRLDAPGAAAFEVDVEKRTIKGLALPYGVSAMSGGQRWQFSKGTLRFADVSRVKLWVQHDANQAVGVATKLEDTDEGFVATFKVARGADGDKALMLAEDGVLDGLSVGLAQGGKFSRKDGINHAVEAPLMEISLTPAPAFDDARVHSVAASAANTKGTNMTPEERARLAALRAKGAATFSADEKIEFAALEVKETAETSEDALDFSAVGTALTDAISAGFASLQGQVRETITATAELQVTEPSPYRFDGVAGEHGFVEDIRAAYASGDQESRQRVETFIDEAFAVTTGNVSTLNPTQNRPDLFVPNLTFTRPLFELVTTGSITDKTPFTVPKFSAAAGLVANHTEGVEPTPGSFSATSQTVAPAPMSGKIEINREVWDQGGSPQADGIIWGEMLNAYYEAVEAKIAAQLAGTPTAELNLAGAVDAALVDAMTAYFAGLQFVRGGNRFTGFASDAKLFPALIAAKDTAGRKLLPVLGPQNAQGTTEGGFDRVSIGNQTVRAAWALAQGANTRSYSFVPSSVWCWLSAPKKFTFEYQVKSIDMAIWGYAGTATLRDSDVKPVDYDTSDA